MYCDIIVIVSWKWECLSVKYCMNCNDYKEISNLERNKCIMFCAGSAWNYINFIIPINYYIDCSFSLKLDLNKDTFIQNLHIW